MRPGFAIARETCPTTLRALHQTASPITLAALLLFFLSPAAAESPATAEAAAAAEPPTAAELAAAADLATVREPWSGFAAAPSGAEERWTFFPPCGGTDENVGGFETACGPLRLAPAVDVAGADTEDSAVEPSAVPASPESTSGKPKKPNALLAGLIAGVAVTGSALNSFLDGPNEPYHVTQEGFFGQDTYAGGADKASHFVDYNIVARELAYLYERLGYSPVRARWMGFGVAAAAGLMTEIGDGSTRYGFSYEDLLMDLFGAGTAVLVSTLGADDLVGFRYGFLVPRETDTCCPVQGLGRDYSNEIYSADFKLAGLARRLGWSLGPAKYLLLSVTYGVKGYPSGNPPDRQRRVGFDIGINISEILNDLGVTRDRWWGYALHVIADNVRFPYTAFGVVYDLNHGTWIGPTTK